MRKIIVCCDSFKGSLSSVEVADCVEEGVRECINDVEIIKLPVADGGEGTVETFFVSLGGRMIEVDTFDPLLREIKANYLIMGDTAYIDISSASGLWRLHTEERNPRAATSFGTGILISDAYAKGIRNFVIGLGGSATIDGGAGILQAIGFKFFNPERQEIPVQNFMEYELDTFEASGMANDIFNCRFTVLSDVTNLLCGENGASYVYGEQKGANISELPFFDSKLRKWGNILKKIGGKDVYALPGSGAAGGIGAMFLEMPNVQFRSGIEEMLRLIRFDEHISDAQLIITGEGCMDRQTVLGKAPYGILCHAKEKNIPVIGIAGIVKDIEILNRAGFTGVFSIINEPVDIKTAMVPGVAKANIRTTVSQIMKLYSISRAM